MLALSGASVSRAQSKRQLIIVYTVSVVRWKGVAL